MQRTNGCTTRTCVVYYVLRTLLVWTYWPGTYLFKTRLSNETFSSNLRSTSIDSNIALKCIHWANKHAHTCAYKARLLDVILYLCTQFAVFKKRSPRVYKSDSLELVLVPDLPGKLDADSAASNNDYALGLLNLANSKNVIGQCVLK